MLQETWILLLLRYLLQSNSTIVSNCYEKQETESQHGKGLESILSNPSAQGRSSGADCLGLCLVGFSVCTRMETPQLPGHSQRLSSHTEPSLGLPPCCKPH